MSRTSRWARAAALFTMLTAPVTARAQWQSNTGAAGARLGATVGGDVERYVRALSIAGIIEPLPWAVRPFSREDLDGRLQRATSAHPWQAALQRQRGARASLGSMVFASANSAFPWGDSDGAMWQGKGVNGAFGAAATFRWGPLSAVAAPVVFWAQNANFRLMPQPAFGYSPYGDAQFPTVIDLPQRMGGAAYTRVDGGESTVRLQGLGLAAGITTASLGWGTGETFPALFGPNAGGFPHLFAGTRAGGLRIPRVGRLNTRYILGVLDQTPWSPVQGSDTFVDAAQSGRRRIGTGLDVSFSPAFLPTLEIGASRFFHSPYRNGASRWDAASKPFEDLFKKNVNDRAGDVDNQLASFFARLVSPKRGLEANFELFREDHNWDSRDLAQEPENNSAVLASVRAITHKRADALAVLTLEYFDGDIRRIGQVRQQGYLYTHAGMLQGHTQRGQLLGAPIGPGAIAAQRVQWERFTPRGSTRYVLQRWRPRSRRINYFEDLTPPANYYTPNSHDWIIDGSVASTRYRGQQAFTLEAGLAWAGMWQLSGESKTNFYARGSWSLF